MLAVAIRDAAPMMVAVTDFSLAPLAPLAIVAMEAV